MRPHDTTIILCAGGMNYFELPIGTNRSNAMIPVRGKPVIAWLLDDLRDKGIDRVTVVIRKDDTPLTRLLHRVHARQLDLRVVELADSRSILDSLRAGLDADPPQGLVRIILGDTLIRDPYDADSDFLYVGPVDTPRKWCIVKTDEDDLIRDYVDKRLPGRSTHLAASGYYHLLDGPRVSAALEEAQQAGCRELSDVLRRYGESRPIRAKTAGDWFDFGHIETLTEARHRLIQPRFFNTMRVDPVLKTITKVSENDAKLRDEFDWYRQLPAELQVLCPRIVRDVEIEGRLHVTQEYYGYPSLAELYLFGDLTPETWMLVLRYVFRIHEVLRSRTGSLPTDAILSMYDAKVWDRIDSWRAEADDDWAALLDAETVVHNGRRLRNLPLLRQAIRDRARGLAASARVGIIHGDYCFSNILFDINNQIIKLIDPRGSFGQKGIYGDPRYDVAKLRHSACGFYDAIVADLFRLDELASDESAPAFRSEIFVGETAHEVAGEFDRFVAEAGYDPAEIRFVEGLLFISMVPLHRDRPQRQKLMYLTGLGLLDEALPCGS